MQTISKTAALYRHRSTELLTGLVEAADLALASGNLTDSERKAQEEVLLAYLLILDERHTCWVDDSTCTNCG